jgi:hypothetical protein
MIVLSIKLFSVLDINWIINIFENFICFFFLIKKFIKLLIDSLISAPVRDLSALLDTKKFKWD